MEARMTKNIFSILFLLALALPFQVQAEPVPGLLGRWVAEQPLYGRDVQFHLSFNFDEEKTTMTVQCAFRNGDSLQISAQAFTRYDGNNIFIVERNEGVVNDGFHFCRATLDRSQWQAYFDGTGKMVLFVPVPYQARFSLVRDI
jgi:hypothetical protein